MELMKMFRPQVEKLLFQKVDKLTLVMDNSKIMRIGHGDRKKFISQMNSFISYVTRLGYVAERHEYRQGKGFFINIERAS